MHSAETDVGREGNKKSKSPCLKLMTASWTPDSVPLSSELDPMSGSGRALPNMGEREREKPWRIPGDSPGKKVQGVSDQNKGYSQQGGREGGMGMV